MILLHLGAQSSVEMSISYLRLSSLASQMIATGELSFREVCSDISDSLIIIVGWRAYPRSYSRREGMRGGGESGGGVGIDGGEAGGGREGRGGGTSCSLQSPDRLAPEGLHLGTEMPLSG